jgi:hypothetical protein
VLSIVASEIGNGPFNILLEDSELSLLNYLNVGSPIKIGINQVSLGEVIVDTLAGFDAKFFILCTIG